MDAPSAPDPLAAIAKARGTARLIVTTTPGVTMTVLAQEDLVDAIAAALAREAATQRHAADHWFTEANREHNARVRAEGERDGIDALWLKARFDAVDAHQQIAALEAALRPLLSLWTAVFPALCEGVDVVDLTEAAEQEGLIALVPHPQPCVDEACTCDGADEWYIETAVLGTARAALAPPERP